jgi:hypothetical protein
VDIKKVEHETAEIAARIVELEKSVEEAEKTEPEKLKADATEETLSAIETTIKASQETIQGEIKGLGEKIKETSTAEPENKMKLQMMGALKGRLESCNGKLAKLFTASKVSLQTAQFEKMVVGVEEEVQRATSEVTQALEDKKTLAADFETMDEAKKIEVATSISNALRLAKESMKDKAAKIQDLFKKLNTVIPLAGPQYKNEYLERLRILQAEFGRNDKIASSESDQATTLLMDIKSSGQVEALKKKADEQKELVMAFVEEIKPMVEGQLTEQETIAKTDEAKKKLEELEGPAKALAEEITAALADIPKTAVKVRESYTKIDNSIKSHSTILKRQSDLINAAAGKSKAKELCRDAAGIVAKVEENINEVLSFAVGVAVYTVL